MRLRFRARRVGFGQTLGVHGRNRMRESCSRRYISRNTPVRLFPHQPVATRHHRLRRTADTRAAGRHRQPLLAAHLQQHTTEVLLPAPSPAKQPSSRFSVLADLPASTNQAPLLGIGIGRVTVTRHCPLSDGNSFADLELPRHGSILFPRSTGCCSSRGPRGVHPLRPEHPVQPPPSPAFPAATYEERQISLFDSRQPVRRVAQFSTIHITHCINTSFSVLASKIDTLRFPN